MRAAFLQIQDRFDDKWTRWLIGWLGQWAFIAAAFVLCMVISYRAGGVRAEKRYEAWKERYVNDFLEQQEAARAGMPADPYETQLDEEAQELARVLYGVKDNSTDDLRTVCWCVFNRVDNTLYPSTLADVIAQPSQWMRYSPDNPVLDNLYKIARAELDAWHTGATRPCSAEFIYMTWSPSRIVLRDAWETGSFTNTWRMGA